MSASPAWHARFKMVIVAVSLLTSCLLRVLASASRAVVCSFQNFK